MSRFKNAETILDAAERWKMECLLNGGSLFGEEKLWTNKCFGYLQRYYVENPNVAGSSFIAKLQAQLAPAPPEAKCLGAEISWIYYLIVSNITPVRKRNRIKRVWEWSGLQFPEEHWALDKVLEQGIVNPGVGYLTYQWREYRFIVTMMLDWLGNQSAEDRESLLNDPWRFAEWIRGIEGGKRRQFPHALLFLLFPDEFEPIMSITHKRKIVDRFQNSNVGSSEIGQMDLDSLDKAMLTIRRQLEDNHPEKEVHFYRPPWKELWQGDASTQNVDEEPNLPDTEAWYKKRFGEADVWVIAPGEGARLWRDFLDSGIAAIGWDDLGDLSQYESREDINRALIESGAGQNPSNQSLAAWEFVHEVKIGDFVLAKRGRNAILGWGTVTGNYAYVAERAEYHNVRDVDWHPCQAPFALNSPIATKTLTRFTAYKDWLSYVFKSIDTDEGGGKEDIEFENAVEGPYGLETALGELFMEETKFRRILDSIALRKNLILQGPPGVGKTFIARRVAWCLMGRKDSRSIGMVQFHQSYAYEDFVQGWRPTETGGFTLREGVFYEFCMRAEKHPEMPFVFIIDEINRGNLSRIFGELLMLIEADKRGPEHAIALTYSASGERFSVPDNVYILGLMNTADRSLAIVDYALRRRFGFETLEPAYGTESFREYLLEADVDPTLVDRIENNLSIINDQIFDDKDLGPGFQIGHSYFMPESQADEKWYLGIVDTQIVPLLREYWFDRPSRADELEEILRQ